MTTREHWEAVYAEKSDEEVSWFQAEPRLSAQNWQLTTMGVADVCAQHGCAATGLARMKGTLSTRSARAKSGRR
jgi:hypothetical protein